MGLIILLAEAIGCGIAALSILGDPPWLWLFLAWMAALAVVAAFAVMRRAPGGRRLTLLMLGAQCVSLVMFLVVAAAVMVAAHSPDIGPSISLVMFIFVPIAIAGIAVDLLAAWSINRLKWPSA